MQISYVIRVFCVVFNHKKRKTGFPEVQTEIAPKHHQVVIKTQCSGVFRTQLEETNRLMGKKSRKSWKKILTPGGSWPTIDEPTGVKHEKSPCRLELLIIFVIRVLSVVFKHKKQKHGFPEVQTDVPHPVDLEIKIWGHQSISRGQLPPWQAAQRFRDFSVNTLGTLARCWATSLLRLFGEVIALENLRKY